MPAEARPIYVQIAQQLHDQAMSGEEDRQPQSVRKVASQFGVSSVTASRALQLLRIRLAKLGSANDEGEIESKATPERWAVCLHVSPGPHQHAAAQLTAAGFRALAQERQVTFDFDSFRSSEGLQEDQIEARVAAAIDSGVGGIFLLPSRVSDQAMRADEFLLSASASARLPVVLIERNLRGEDRPIEHDLVSFHDFEGGRLLTRHLLDQGRKRIAFLTGSPTSSHVERIAGYLSALHSAGVPEKFVTEQSTIISSGAAYTELASRLIDWQADGVICYHEYAAVGLIMELLRRGKAVPGDTAVAAFYSLGLGESFSIGITAYSYPARTVAARALDVMRWRIKTPDAPPVKMIVPGELVVRNSTTA